CRPTCRASLSQEYPGHRVGWMTRSSAAVQTTVHEPESAQPLKSWSRDKGCLLQSGHAAERPLRERLKPAGAGPGSRQAARTRATPGATGPGLRAALEDRRHATEAACVRSL